MLNFRFDAYDPATGAFLRTMPAPVKAQIGDVFGDRNTLALSYAGAPEIPTFLEIRASVYFGGEWTPVGPSYLRLGGSHADTDPSGLREVNLVSREWILGKARVGEGELELIDGKRPFYQASPGEIMRTLLLEAQDRGAARGIELGGFTAAADTDGTAWSKVATIYYSPGLPIGDVLSNLVEQGMCDYRMVGNRLELFEPETALGRDLTTGGNPVRLRGAVSEAPVTYTLEDLTTSALLIGEDGFQVEVDNPSAPDDYGRMEVTIEQGGVSSEGTARTMIDAELQRGSREIRQITRTQHSSGAPFLPYRDYRVGDFVQALDQGQWQRYRVREIQLVMDGTGWTIHTVLNDRLEELLLRLANRTNGIVNGSKGSGGDGTRPAPPPAPGIEPAAPEGLVLDQQVYLDGNGDARGVVTAGWGAVTESTRGQRIDVGGYELWRRDNETYAPWRMVARTDGPLEATDSPVPLTRGDGSAAEYQWRVRAIAEASGRTGLWSREVTLTMTQDTTPPPPPSLPVVETGFRIVTASWDGLTEDGTEMPPDFSRVRVYLAATESMTDAELVGALQYPGAWNSETMPAGVPVWVAFSAVDRVGNESALTPAVTVTPQALVDEESIQEEVDRIDGTIEGAVDALQENIDNIVIDGFGATTYQTPYEPDETTDPAPKAGDIWFNTADNMRLHRYNGTAWVSAADERIQTIEDAQEQFGQDITDAEARALAEAQALAEQARIDAEGNAATDAQEKANAARDAAISEAETKDQQVRSDIDSVIGSARDDLESQINTVRTSVDGKNAITQSVDAPPTSYDGAVGDRWERMSSMGSGGSLISNWRWNGDVWVGTIISDGVLGNVDAAKIGTGYLDAERIEAGSIRANKLLIGSTRNLIPNGDLSAGSAVGWPSEGVYDGADTPPGFAASVAWPPVTATYRLRDFGTFPVSLGDTLVFEVWVKADKPGSRLYIEARDQGNAHIASGQALPWQPEGWTNGTNVYPVGQVVVPTVWTRWRTRLVITNPDTVRVALGTLYVNHSSGTETTAEVRTSGLALYKAVGSTLIEDGAITTDKILANAITASKIDAGAINAEHIVAGGIEASSLIVGGSIGETLIQDGAITTRTIRADAVGADAIAAGVIDAGHIIAGGIQADAILVGGSVGSTLIENGAVTTEKIEVGAITATSGIIESLNAGVITVGELDAARIGANTITGDKLLIGGGSRNLLPGVEGLGDASIPNTRSGWSAFGRNSAHPSVWLQGRVTERNDVPFYLEAGEYIHTVAVQASVAGTSFYTQLIGPANQYLLANQTPGTSWTSFEHVFTVTTPGLYQLNVWANHTNGANNDSGYQWFRGLSIRSRVGGTLIEDGAITTDKILANAITAGKIRTGAITAGKIAANAVEADTIAGGAIDGKIITGATVRTSETGARVVLDASGLRAYNASGGQTLTVSAQTGAVSMTGNLTQANSYGDMRVGPSMISGSTSSPSILFRRSDHNNNFLPSGLYLRDDLDGYPQMFLQSASVSQGGFSQLGLAAGESPDNTSFRRIFPGGYWTGLDMRRDSVVRLYRADSSGSIQERVTLAPSGELSLTDVGGQGFYRNSTGYLAMKGRGDSRLAIDSGGFTSLRSANGDGSRETYITLDMASDMIQVVGSNLSLYRIPTGTGVPLYQSGARVYRGSSARRNKLRIEDAEYGTPDLEDKLLGVRARSWYEKGNADAYAEHLDALDAWEPLADGEECEACEERAAGEPCRKHREPDPVPVPRRNVGAIAEEVDELGLDSLVIYDSEGAPEGLAYDRFGIMLIPIVKRLRDRVTELETTINERG